MARRGAVKIVRAIIVGMNAFVDTLLARHSLGGKHLIEPGPDAAALALMAQAAARAPDHAGLRPCRFIAVQGPARQQLADLFEQAAREAGKDAAAQAIERERALRVPVTVAVVARIDAGHPLVPAHEQWCAVGGALANFLNAAHGLGFAGKMLSGHKVRRRLLQQAFCGPGETLVGWLSIGTAAKALASKHEGQAGAALLSVWPGARDVKTSL